MKPSPHSQLRLNFHLGGLLMTVGLICCSLALNAFEAPLTPAALHDAWTLGQRNDQATAEFLAPYSKQVTEGSQQVPHIAEIEVLTPFAQVLDESRRNMNDYSEQQGAMRSETPMRPRLLADRQRRYVPRISGKVFISPSSNTEKCLSLGRSTTNRYIRLPRRRRLHRWMAKPFGWTLTLSLSRRMRSLSK
jgi:hypothetical protein